MTIAVRTSSAALAIALLAAACSSGAPSASAPAASAPATSAPAASAATASVLAALASAAAGKPCSFLTADAVGAIVGAARVEGAERIGRGGCAYRLNAAKDSKVNVEVFTGSEATSYFEITKNIGTPQPVSVGDDAYSIYNESLGTIVVARKGDTVVAVQVLAGTVAADQLRQATALVQAALAAL